MNTEAAETSRQDVRTIRQLIENWVVWRDSGDWERFRTVWHSDGAMMATWFQGVGDEFIRVSREGWERGVNILHAEVGPAQLGEIRDLLQRAYEGVRPE